MCLSAKASLISPLAILSLKPLKSCEVKVPSAVLFRNFLQRYAFLRECAKLILILSFCLFPSGSWSTSLLTFKLQLIDRLFKSLLSIEFTSLLLRSRYFFRRSSYGVYAILYKIIISLFNTQPSNHTKQNEPYPPKLFNSTTLQFTNSINSEMRGLKKYLNIAVYNNNDPFLQLYLEPVDILAPPKTLKKDIELLRKAAAHHQLVSLAANQISMTHRMFAILKEEFIVPGKWRDYESTVEDYDVVINPQLVSENTIKFKDFQECPSVPGMRFAVWNPTLQKYAYQRPVIHQNQLSFEKQSKVLKGFKARLWDHEVRHLNGILVFAEDVSHRQVYVNDEFRDNPGMHQMVEAMKKDLKLMSQQSLAKMFKKGIEQQKKDKKKADIDFSADELPEKITKDLKKRLGRQYTRVKQALSKQSQDSCKRQ